MSLMSVRLFAGVSAACLTLALGGVSAAQDGVAAARLPNAFGQPVRATPAPQPVAQPSSPAPSPTEAADPRSEAALRGVIAAAQAETLDYAVFTPGVGETMQQGQGQTLMDMVENMGALRTLVFAGRQNGADLYRARFEAGDTQWIVGMDEAGKIAVFLFRETPVSPQ